MSSKIFHSKIAAEFGKQPLLREDILQEEEMAQLPNCVQQYLRYTGAIGKSKPQNVFIEFEVDMYRKPGSKAMKSHSVQYNFYHKYARFFFMKASMMGIPFRALHIFNDFQASFTVKVADLFKVVDIRGDELTKAETVTILNDMCVFAPGSLTDSRLKWAEIDALTAKVTLTNGKYIVSAILYFNEVGELVNFVSEDRSALQDDGSLKQARWETPIADYKEFDGRKIPTYGETIWKYPEGDFKYGVFRLKSIEYNRTK